MTKHTRYILLFSFLVVITSCKKKTPEDIGLPFLPDSDLLNAEFTDTLLLISHTVKDDSVVTKNVVPMLLGSYSDPIFGPSSASIFTQLALSKSNPNFGTSPVLDSAVLSLVFSNSQYYGMIVPQKFNVYEVTQALHKDTVYYSDRLLPYSTQLGSSVITPSVTDSVPVDTLKYPAHLRIYLDKAYFQNFLDGKPSTFYSSNANMQADFKGIYIATSSGDGGIFSLDLAHLYSRLTLFYHNTTDTTSYYFTMPKDASISTKYSFFSHDYSMTTDIQNQIHTSDNIQADKVFVQPMGGVRTKITFPHIMDLYKNGKVAINKAELILRVDESSLAGADTTPHPKLVATIADSVLGPVIMPDYFEGATYFGGDYDASKKEYHFNIARYVQQVLNGTRVNQGLYIITNARPTTANRTVLVGGNPSLGNHMRLKITYTPLE